MSYAKRHHLKVFRKTKDGSEELVAERSGLSWTTVQQAAAEYRKLAGHRVELIEGGTDQADRPARRSRALKEIDDRMRKAERGLLTYRAAAKEGAAILKEWAQGQD